MKYLIVGLGNIGSEYKYTRHNVGFEVVDLMAEKADAKFENVRYGAMASVKHKGRTLLLLKPNTYMNLSGQAVRFWLQKEKIPIERLMVIFDDLNLDFGKVRIKGKGSSGGHNGLKNIEALLETNEYPRMKIGIGSKYKKGKQVDFVLGRWTEEEAMDLGKILKHCGGAVKGFCTLGLERTMNLFNKKVVNPPAPPNEEA